MTKAKKGLESLAVWQKSQDVAVNIHYTILPFPSTEENWSAWLHKCVRQYKAFPEPLRKAPEA
jgi:hypothetical protein